MSIGRVGSVGVGACAPRRHAGWSSAGVEELACMILLSCWVLFAPGVLNDAVRLVSPADDWRTGEGPSWLVVG